MTSLPSARARTAAAVVVVVTAVAGVSASAADASNPVWYGLFHRVEQLIVLPLVSDPSLSATPPTALGCPTAAGRLGASQLGPLKLGMTRRAARAAFASPKTHGRRYMDFFCIRGGGIRVGYASPKLLRKLRTSRRRRFAGRLILALTNNPRYSVNGIRPRTRLSIARDRLRLTLPFVVGANTWYLAPNGPGRVILKVRHGIVVEIGIASAGLTRHRRSTHRFLTSFY